MRNNALEVWKRRRRKRQKSPSERPTLLSEGAWVKKDKNKLVKD